MASFVPRVVQRKNIKTTSQKTAEKPKHLPTKTEKRQLLVVDLRGQQDESNCPKTIENARNLSDEEQRQDDDDEVISYSKNQRWPEDGEPVCIMCGRYGEYICSQTDKDVCSLECKARHLKSSGIALQNATKEHITLTISSDKHDNSDDYYSTFYTEHPTIRGLTSDQVEQLQKRLEIKVQGDGIARPILEFYHCQFSKTLSDNIATCGYISPTPIQMQLIPVALTGRDVVACAQTGSGKTAAFLLPMIAKIYSLTGELSARSTILRHPIGLILAPTRELCMQIEKQAKELIQGLKNMRTALLVGGLPLPPQLHRIQMGVQIIIATPGRLLEILSKDAIDLTHVNHLVLDEVDSMLQLGFEQQVQEVIEKLNDDKQTILVSATIPTAVETMVNKLTCKPVFISVGNPSTPTQAVKHLILWVEETAKKKHLFSILCDAKHYSPPVVVFVDSKIGADLLAEAIYKVCKIPCVSMHGDKEQKERTEILQSYIEGQYPVIVCTGVLGRGVDLLNVKQVINFDMPSTIEEYIHQVGRTGRLGTNGVAMTFINNNNKNVFLDLIDTLLPMGVSLPGELTNSSYVSQLRSKKKQGMKRKERDEIVNQGDLMDLLKKSSTRRKRN